MDDILKLIYKLEIFKDGGPAMWPLLGLSILSVSVILERLWFWARSLTKEKDIVNRVLDAATQDWGVATEIARRSSNKPIGRFLYAPLRLNQPEPEVFRLALETAAEEELGAMRQGDKILEGVIALAPLLGLFGTVWGLIVSLRSIRISDIGTSAASEVTLGIGEALISTAAGLVVAITSLAFYRLFQLFLFGQIKVFRKAGNELELLYRQFWSQTGHSYSPSTRSRNTQKPKPKIENTPNSKIEDTTNSKIEDTTNSKIENSPNSKIEDTPNSKIENSPNSKIDDDTTATVENSD